MAGPVAGAAAAEKTGSFCAGALEGAANSIFGV